MIISKREGGEDVRRLKAMLRETKENIMDICDMVEQAEVEMQERSGYRDGYGERSRYRDDGYGERRHY
jgi:hypothetical protein